MTTYGPYTPVRKAGNLLFVSGQVGINPSTKTAQADIADQTRQAIQNLELALKEVNAELGDVVKTTLFLTDMNDFAAVNTICEQVFPAPRPARSTVGVNSLPRIAGETPLLIEIDAVAYKAVA